MATTTSISFVIRTYNEARYLGVLLDTLASQTNVNATCEFIVVDSGSTDRTVEIATQRRTVLLQIPKEHFDYSRALNCGIENCRSPLIIIISAHAIPCDNNWLQLMISHFRDEKVAGVFCRQVPWPDAYPREVQRLQRMFGTEAIVYELGGNAASGPQFSNAASCIRRELWERHHFVLPAAEDIEWATWAVAHGYKIIYEAGASVYHSHNDTCRQMARRTIQFEKAADIRLKRRRGFGLILRQGIGYALRDIRDVAHLRNPKPARPKLICDVLFRTYWFIRDFERV